MRIIPASLQTRMPWKNGGGETVEIAAYPPDTGRGAFGWRVSVARQEGDATFSRFDGVDRTLAIVAGEGLDLDIEGLGTHRLTLAGPAFSFPADAAATGRVLAGPVSNFNVMTRRGTYSHRVDRRDVDGVVACAATSRWTLVWVGGPIRLQGGGGVELGARDALLVEGEAAPLHLTAPGPTPVLLVSIDPV